MRSTIIPRFVVLATLVAGLSSRALRAGPWIETARLAHAGGSEGARLGWWVAVDGDVAVVGQPGFAGRTGAARVFVRSGGVWNESATLVQSNPAIGDEFGLSVAISGDTIVVGAPNATVGDAEGEGEAYVFVRPAGGWSGMLSEDARLQNFNQGAETGPDSLGNSVSISGNTIAIGAPSSLGSTGLTLVYVEPRTGWSGDITPAAVLEAPSSGQEGFSVAISGDVVVAGASATSDNEDGEAYVWEKPPDGWSGILTESADLLPETPFFHGQFGIAVAIDGTTVIVGSNFAQYTNSENQTTGVAYVFVQPAGGWAGTLNETARLVPSADKLNLDTPAFGNSVSISGDTAVIGTPGLRVFPFSTEDGGAFVFRKPAIGWTGDVGEQAKILRIDSTARQSALGRSVSISGTTILLGAPQETVGTNEVQGAAHVFEPGLNPTVTATFIPGSVLTHQASSLLFVVSNPNTAGFLSNFGFDVTLPPGLFVDAVPNILSSCGPADVEAPPDSSVISESGGTIPASFTCASQVNVSSGIPGTYVTVTSPVTCDQGCDGVGSAPATLLVRLRQTQTRFLVQGPVRVAPGVPVEFMFQVEGLRESPIAPIGEVVVSDGAGHTCRSDVNVSGEGSCTLTFGSPGTYRVRAEYLGNLSFAASTSPLEPVLVGRAP